MYKKGLTLAIIILFIGVSFQPVFAHDIKQTEETVIESTSGIDEKVEYVIQIVKTNKIIEHKVYLTQQQANELENLIEGIRFDLNNSDSIEETTEIYNDAINSFNNLDLFPEDITLDEIKQLVFGETQKLYSIKFKKEIRAGFENRFCLVAGKTSSTFFSGPTLLLFGSLYILFEYLSANFSNFKLLSLFFHILGFISLIISVPLMELFMIESYIYSIIPVSIGSIVTFGIRTWSPGYHVYYYPAYGWIHTNGKNGVKNYSGWFYGQIFTFDSGFTWTAYYIGIVGFTGIRIFSFSVDDINYYLGFALKVHVGTEYP